MGRTPLPRRHRGATGSSHRAIVAARRRGSPIAVGLCIAGIAAVAGCAEPEGSPGTVASSVATSTALPVHAPIPAEQRAATVARTAEILAPTLDADYTGDAACAECHATVSASFEATNKHRSLSRFDPATAPERLEGTIRVHNAATNLSYEVFLRDGRLVQREFRLDADGRRIHELEWAADWVIGSGNATRSYLLEENGYLTEMPLTWYVERGVWDMSPGYEEANDRFDRKIVPGCITCHAGRPTHSDFTQNHYPDIPGGIGCESCHGPGSLHVEARRGGGNATGRPAGDGASRAVSDGPSPDRTIVNPARLDRDRQLSICQQCHLAGVMVFPEGESPTTFRPGMTLAEHRTVFVPAEQLVDPEWVGIDSHPLRLARSQCYIESEMTCSSCHAPHSAGGVEAGASYSDKCVSCHGGGDDPSPHLCARPEATDHAAATSGDCVSCHMVRGGTSDVPHVTFTDHWIRREPGPPRDPSLGRPAFDGPNRIELVALQAVGKPSHDLSARTPEGPAHELERAAAVWEFYETMHRHPSYVPDVIRIARRGFAGGAEHVEARIALSRALADADSLDAALRVAAEAVALHPDHAFAGFWYGALLERAGNTTAARERLEGALELQPRLSEARIELANVLYATGDRSRALELLRGLAADDPVHAPDALFNAGVLLLESADSAGATAAFDEARRRDPDLTEAHVQYGTLRLAAGDSGGAEAALLAALESDPRSVAALGTLAVLHANAGRMEEARTRLRELLEVDPTNAAAQRMLERIR